MVKFLYKDLMFYSLLLLNEFFIPEDSSTAEMLFIRYIQKP
jgi:hypothetical protein